MIDMARKISCEDTIWITSTVLQEEWFWMECPTELFLCFLSKTGSICFYYCCSFPVILIDWQREWTHPVPQRRQNKGSSVTWSLALIWRKRKLEEHAAAGRPEENHIQSAHTRWSQRPHPAITDTPHTHTQSFYPDIVFTFSIQTLSLANNQREITPLPHGNAKRLSLINARFIYSVTHSVFQRDYVII